MKEVRFDEQNSYERQLAQAMMELKHVPAEYRDYVLSTLGTLYTDIAIEVGRKASEAQGKINAAFEKMKAIPTYPQDKSLLEPLMGVFESSIPVSRSFTSIVGMYQNSKNPQLTASWAIGLFNGRAREHRISLQIVQKHGDEHDTDTRFHCVVIPSRNTFYGLK